MNVEVNVTGQVVCAWFAKCTRPAESVEPHPAFADGVPICGPCKTWLKENS